MMLLLMLGTAQADDCADVSFLLEHLEHADCPTMTLLQLSDLDCDDPRLAPFARSASPQPSPPPPGIGKGLRDSYGMDFSAESENFVLRWGGSGNWPSSRADSVLTAFEDAWALILEDMDYALPAGADDYKFNLYIGNTGGPGAYGSAYYTRDSNGWPMVVITPGTFEDASWGATVGAHEFFHALQDASGAPYQYAHGSRGAWYWEATANWIETEIYPENRAQNVTGFLMGYALLPHLPIYFFDYPDTGSLEEYHQYGAFIFPYYISRNVADAALIRASWMEAEVDDPLVELDERLQADWGTDITSVFFDFAASNVTWEAYDDGDVFASYIDYYASYYDSLSTRETVTSGADSNGWQDAPRDSRPERFGTNHLVITPGSDDIAVSFAGEATGSSGSAATWDVRAVVVDGGQGTTTAIPLTDGEGALEIEGSGGAEAVWVVVSVASEDISSGETFAWSYNVGSIDTPQPIDTGTPEDSGDGGSPVNTVTPTPATGCGCQGGFLAWTVLLPLAWGRRRR